jgi:hypothetical protein
MLLRRIQAVAIGFRVLNIGIEGLILKTLKLLGNSLVQIKKKKKFMIRNKALIYKKYHIISVVTTQQRLERKKNWV